MTNMPNAHAQEKIQHLQHLEQNMQHLLKQRQQFQMQLMEIDSAADELKKTEKAYRIIGNIMVLSDKATLDKEVTVFFPASIPPVA